MTNIDPREINKRNLEAIRKGSTDRYCLCGQLATFGVGVVRPSQVNPEGVERWMCRECWDKRQEEKP